MHGNTFNMLRTHLPQLDLMIEGLVLDLESRGLLDQTLVVVMGEMGRTPKINAKGGRDHWGKIAPLMLSGGGLKMGQVIGASDRQAAEPATRPYNPKHLTSTIMHSVIDIGQLRVTDGIPKPVIDTIASGSPIEEWV